MEEYHIRYNKHLNAQYIPDAHGLPLLTDAHLGHANDLSDWIIEPLGEAKHLVQAKDLEPWYATIDPDPATLAKARADFGGILLTPEIIADNPPPGTQPHPFPGGMNTAGGRRAIPRTGHSVGGGCRP